MRFFRAAVLPLAFVLATGLAHAQTGITLQDRLRNDTLSRHQGLDLRVIEMRENRRAFQENQQRLREDDRLKVEQRLDLEVPRVKPTCQTPIRGNDYLRPGCR